MPIAARVAESVVETHVAGIGVVRADLSQIAQLRKAPGRFGNQSVAPILLKHSEEQTVVGLAAVLQVIDQNAWHERAFADWGVIAAPNLFGRFMTADSLRRFQKDGAWGMSPHAIPHGSLHGLSGTISQALKMHGPNFGIGGGPQATSEAFLLAAALLSEDLVRAADRPAVGLEVAQADCLAVGVTAPGLWVVLTGYDPELLPQDFASGASFQGARCLAVALALTRGREPTGTISLRVGVGASAQEATLPEYTWPQFVAALESLARRASEATADVPTHWRLPGGGWLALSKRAERSQRAA